MDIRLYVPKYHHSVFAAILGSGTPEPVLVMLLAHLPMHESIMVEMEADGREYEICKVYQQDLGDYDAAHFFKVRVTMGTVIECFDTYVLWVANGVALGLFRLLMDGNVCVGLERAEHWGTAWTPWAQKENGQWTGVADGDRITDFVIQQLATAVDEYMEENAGA